MFTGLYRSATALDGLNQQQEAVASNLAHLNTPGHRRLILTFREQMDQTEGSDQESGTTVERPSADFSQGRQQATGRPLDLSIQGDGFFVYRGESGEMYSRSGVVFRNPESNELVNGDGFPILDDGGSPIVYDGPLSELGVGADGTVSQRGVSVGKIALVQFDDNHQLSSENQTYFRAGGATPSPAENYSIVQGSRELSNAHPVMELISMMVGSRHFEASQRAIRTLSDAIQENTRS
jgi:flagellar basal body rod protein FlgG